MDCMYTADGPDRDHTGGWHCPYSDKRSCIQDDKRFDDLWNTTAVDLRVVHLAQTLVVVLICVSMFWIPEGIALVILGMTFVQAKLRDFLDQP